MPSTSPSLPSSFVEKAIQSTKVNPGSNGNGRISPTQNSSPRLSLLARLEHFTWAWFTITMSTGGLALLLSAQPYTFRGLRTIGKVVYIFDLLLFVLVCSAIITRFVKYPGTLKKSLTHPTEGLFFATMFLSLASIISCMEKYGVTSVGPWLIVVYRVLFWIYFALTFTSGVLQYYYLFTAPQLTIQDMVPAWILPIFPFMLSGTISNVGAGSQPPSQAVPMIVAGLTGQGLGMIVSVLLFSQYIRRLIQYGLPAPNTRPGMFISAGPPSFTALAIIGLARDFPAGMDYFGDPAVTQQVLKIMATFTAVFLWSLGFWFFCISAIACIVVAHEMSFHLSWWAFVFPNVGFTIATINIGVSLKSEGIQWVGSAMTILLVVMYIFVFCAHVKAVWKCEILYPGMDEDVQHDAKAQHAHEEEEHAMRRKNA